MYIYAYQSLSSIYEYATEIISKFDHWMKELVILFNWWYKEVQQRRNLFIRGLLCFTYFNEYAK